MKRLFFTLVAMLSMTMTFAENENAANVNNTEAYNMTVNIRKLGEALGLTTDQMEAVGDVNHTFSAEMLFAAQMNKDERDARVAQAVSKNVKYMRYILDDKQYRKYLLLLNTTLNNRGLNPNK